MYASQANGITLTLVYVSMLSNKAFLPTNYFSYINPSCFFILSYRISLYSQWGIIFYLATNYSGATKITVSS